MADYYESETYDKEKSPAQHMPLGKRELFASVTTRLDTRFNEDRVWRRHGGPVLRPTGAPPKVDVDDPFEINGFKRLKM